MTLRGAEASSSESNVKIEFREGMPEFPQGPGEEDQC